jgi:hypothetical protein
MLISKLRFSIFFLLIAWPLTAEAALPLQIDQHFAPLSGSIIMPVANEYLIDLDSSANLQIGDILTLVTPGEQVLHPITKEVLGTINSPVGFLQVTQIKSGYSYARLLYSDSIPQKGNQIRRFVHVPARFLAKQGNGEELYRELKNRLPQLKWLHQGSAEEPLLLFTLEDNTLSVTTSSGILLHSYNTAPE